MSQNNKPDQADLADLAELADFVMLRAQERTAFLVGYCEWHSSSIPAITTTFLLLTRSRQSLL